MPRKSPKIWPNPPAGPGCTCRASRYSCDKKAATRCENSQLLRNNQFLSDSGIPRSFMIRSTANVSDYLPRRSPASGSSASQARYASEIWCSAPCGLALLWNTTSFDPTVPSSRTYAAPQKTVRNRIVLVNLFCYKSLDDSLPETQTVIEHRIAELQTLKLGRPSGAIHKQMARSSNAGSYLNRDGR